MTIPAQIEICENAKRTTQQRCQAKPVPAPEVRRLNQKSRSKTLTGGPPHLRLAAIYLSQIIGTLLLNRQRRRVAAGSAIQGDDQRQVARWQSVRQTHNDVRAGKA